MIHSSKIDYFVQDDTPLMEAHFSEPNETETAIGKHCAALIEDGATLQMGICLLYTSSDKKQPPDRDAIRHADEKSRGLQKHKLKTR